MSLAALSRPCAPVIPPGQGRPLSIILAQNLDSMPPGGPLAVEGGSHRKKPETSPLLRQLYHLDRSVGSKRGSVLRRSPLAPQVQGSNSPLPAEKGSISKGISHGHAICSSEEGVSHQGYYRPIPITSSAVSSSSVLFSWRSPRGSASSFSLA